MAHRAASGDHGLLPAAAGRIRSGSVRSARDHRRSPSRRPAVRLVPSAVTLKLVWEPIRIGSVEIQNRIARAANTTTISAAGIDEQFIAYHRARARGGVGLSILEAAGVHPSSVLSYRIEDSVCRGFERLMQAVRPFGMRVFQQLWHGGHHIPGLEGRLPWAPSDVPSPF